MQSLEVLLRCYSSRCEECGVCVHDLLPWASLATTAIRLPDFDRDRASGEDALKVRERERIEHETILEVQLLAHDAQEDACVSVALAHALEQGGSSYRVLLCQLELVVEEAFEHHDCLSLFELLQVEGMAHDCMSATCLLVLVLERLCMNDQT